MSVQDIIIEILLNTIFKYLIKTNSQLIQFTVYVIANLIINFFIYYKKPFHPFLFFSLFEKLTF